MEVSVGGIGGMLFRGEPCLPPLDALVDADDLVNMLLNSKASRGEVLLSVLYFPASIPFGGWGLDLVKRARNEAGWTNQEFIRGETRTSQDDIYRSDDRWLRSDRYFGNLNQSCSYNNGIHSTPSNWCQSIYRPIKWRKIAHGSCKRVRSTLGKISCAL